MFSKKAKKIDQIFTIDLTLCGKCQIDGEDLVNFCGLLRKHELYFFGDRFEYCLSNPIQTLAHWIEYSIRKLQIFYDDLIFYDFIHTSLVINSNIPCQKLYKCTSYFCTQQYYFAHWIDRTPIFPFSRIYKPISLCFSKITDWSTHENLDSYFRNWLMDPVSNLDITT